MRRPTVHRRGRATEPWLPDNRAMSERRLYSARPGWAARLAAIAIGSLLAAGAAAQYKWVDESGRVVYSDRPPTSSKGPVTTLRPVGPAAPGPGAPASPERAAPAAGTREAEPAGRSLVEREQAMRKRQQEREQAERKAAEESRRSAELARACQDRQADLRVLESGARIATIDGSGERSFLNDDQITRRLETLRKAIADECRRGG
jgi:hypothetical protein